MSTTTVKPDVSGVCFGLSPAVPTDTTGIVSRLLKLCEYARNEREAETAAATEAPIIPRTVLRMLLRCMKLRDPSIVLHGQRIAAISSGVAQLLGWDDIQRRQIEVAGLLHDLGKIGVSQHILHKPGKLSSEEYDLVTLHHHAAVSLLQALQADNQLVGMLTLLYHNFDGSGVGIEGPSSQDLPLGPRILAVADAYDSLSSPKAYRRGMAHDEVMKVLFDQAGSRYDGNIVRTLGRWYEADGHQLFRHSDPFCSPEDSTEEPSVEQRNEIVVLTQMLHVLYQFQMLYDGYFILDTRGNYCIWSDGMPGLTGLPLEHVVGRSWKATDVRLSPITQTDRQNAKPREEIVSQVMRNGRSQFGSRVCQINDSQQVSVDVYTTGIAEHPRHVEGVVQLFRCKGGVRRQSKEYVELKLAATRDALTGVANRGQLETQLRHLIDDFHNHEGTRHLSAIFLDVDRFKNINDTFGHKTGDQVLVDLTRLLQHETYSGELIGRYGGEEFVLLCPDTDLQAAIRRGERLRHAIAKSSIGGVSKLSVTSSFGVSTARLGDSVQTLLERADAALYRAKETGRNRTCWEGQADDEPSTAENPFDESAPKVTEIDGKLQFRESIPVSTSLELTAMKLNAFLATQDARITHQEHGAMNLQCGSLGLLGCWGSTVARQPVSVDIRFETARNTDTKTGNAKTLRFVVVTAVPVGRVTDVDTFETRCTMLMQQLRAYLLSS
ncbi:MAG: diguanylate cyclase [Planctomycetaceae bacterium]